MKALRLILVAIAVTLAAPARAADPALQRSVLAAVNDFRTARGLPPLRLDPGLSRAAALHSRDMLGSGRLSHAGSDGSDPGPRISRAGYRWRAWRENVGAGYASAEAAVAGWVRSPGHRDNLLAREVTEAGIGFAEGPGMLPGNIPRRFWTLVLAAPR